MVRRRGELMYETGMQRPGAMAAILGVLTVPIDTICAQATAEREVGLVRDGECAVQGLLKAL